MIVEIRTLNNDVLGCRHFWEQEHKRPPPNPNNASKARLRWGAHRVRLAMTSAHNDPRLPLYLSEGRVLSLASSQIYAAPMVALLR